jgi:hypothetical protein
MDDSGLHGGFDWETAEDVTALSEDLGYRRAILRGRIDLIRAELVERGAVALPPWRLARVLLGEEPS